LEQIELLRHAVRAFDALGVEYMVVGSLASMAYGEPRMTRDIDIVANLRSHQVDAFCEAFPDADYCVSRDAAHDAVRRRSQFNVIHSASGNKIDLMIARDDAWGHMQLARRRNLTLAPGLTVFTAAPEDVILGKMLYYQDGQHEKHLRDITAMLRISGGEIDREYVDDWSKRLGLNNVWQAVLSRAGNAAEP
jgi:hypothetical protein